MPLYNKILFFPDKSNYDQLVASELIKLANMGTPRLDVYFPSANGTRLNGWLFKVPAAKRVVLVSHGNGGNMASRLILAQALVKTGASVFLYDYEGYGKSAGQPSVTAVCNDATGAFDYLTNTEKIAPDKIVVYGESIGSGVTCELARRRMVQGIILQDGFPSLTYAAHDRLWFTWLYPDSWFPQLDCLSLVKERHSPLLLIHGRDDSMFPIRYAKYLYKAATPSKTLAVIDNMEHYLSQPDNEEFLESVRTFFVTLESAK